MTTMATSTSQRPPPSDQTSPLFASNHDRAGTSTADLHKPSSHTPSHGHHHNHNHRHSAIPKAKAKAKPPLRIPCPPPSFHHPQPPHNTRPYYLFPLFVLLNLLTMADRAIIPGASREFSAFLSSASDSPPLVRRNPDAGLGILQAAFIGGYSVAIVFNGHYVHSVRWKTLVLGGLCVWWLGVLGSGNARGYNSFYVLLASRMASGVSEAAFHLVAPPLIQDRAGIDWGGLWLAVYLTGAPVGLAVGYVYGSYVAGHERWGWEWAFYWELLASLPLLLGMALVRDEVNGGVLSGMEGWDGEMERDEGEMVVGEESPLQSTHQPLLSAANGTEEDGYYNGITTSPSQSALTRQWNSQKQQSVTQSQSHHSTSREKQEFTLLSEIKTCLSSPILVALSLGYAAMIGVVSSLGTFGGAFILALQLFDDERTAAVCFGIAAALSGVIGTPLGGKLVDRVMERHFQQDNRNPNHNNHNQSPRTTTSSSTPPSPFANTTNPMGLNIDPTTRNTLLSSLLPRLNLLVLFAVLFVLPTLLMQQAAFFLSFLFLGWTFLFATQTGLMVSAMLSVDRAHRPNALAFLTLTSHILGDVPAPIALGWIKDRLAPECRIGEDGDFEDPEGCAKEEEGVRLGLGVAYLWMGWSLVFFEVARWFAKRGLVGMEAKEKRKGGGEDGYQRDDGGKGGREGGDDDADYYHSRFQQEHSNDNYDNQDEDDVHDKQT